jgi:hypothetical protein
MLNSVPHYVASKLCLHVFPINHLCLFALCVIRLNSPLTLKLLSLQYCLESWSMSHQSEESDDIFWSCFTQPTPTPGLYNYSPTGTFHQDQPTPGHVSQSSTVDQLSTIGQSSTGAFHQISRLQDILISHLLLSSTRISQL